MASVSVESLAIGGEIILRAKRYILSFCFLWFWDYALTFKDEVNYAWKGKKSWVFVLFLLNRYWPLPYLIWVFFASYWSKFPQTACDKTAFLSVFYFTFATLFAQTTLTIRIYAVTGRNKILTVILVCISLAQLFFGCYVSAGVRNSGSKHWPDIPLDAFRLCFFDEARGHEATVMTFSLSYDLLAFLIVVWVGRKGRGSARYRIPTILDKIVRDATVYFLVLFTSHLVVEFFIIFAPSTYHLLPANSIAMFIPIMSSRLMLSLKKAADESGSFTCTEDVNVVTDVLFAGGHTTMEQAMESGVSRHDRERSVDAVELVENRDL